MFQYWVIYKKVYFSEKNDQKCPKFAKWELSLKKGLGSPYTPYWSLNSCKISKKSNEPILSNIQKSWFFPTAPPTFGLFCPKSRERKIFQIWDLHRKLANHKTLHFRSFLEKNLWLNFAQESKNPIFAIFLPFFWAHFALNLENENFPRYEICTES